MVVHVLFVQGCGIGLVLCRGLRNAVNVLDDPLAEECCDGGCGSRCRYEDFWWLGR